MNLSIHHSVGHFGETIAVSLAGISVFTWFSSIIGFANEYYHVVAVISGLVSIAWYIRKYILDKIAERRANRKMKSIEQMAMTDEEIISKSQQIQIRANGKHEYIPFSKKK